MTTQHIGIWLEPLAEDISGPDLEYDPVFLALSQAAQGRIETQFASAETPAWTVIHELSQGLFERTRDLRVALMWGRAAIHLEGLEGLAAALMLLHGLLERFWDEVHPRPDPEDGNTLARLSILGSLNALDGLLGDVRQTELIADRRLGGLRVRDVEIALGRLAMRSDEQASTPTQIEGLLGDHADLATRLRGSVEASLNGLRRLKRLMNERFGMDKAIETESLRDMLVAVQSLIPESVAEILHDAGTEAASATDNADDKTVASTTTSANASRGVTSIESRKDAIRAIRLVYAYLERNEPTNPAQLLLRRAERLIDKNFLQLVRDLAPDATNDLARVLGIDLESLNEGSGRY